MPTRPAATITVQTVGPLPSPEGIAARFLALAKRMGWLEDFIESPGESEGLLGQANGQEAHGGQQPFPVTHQTACSIVER